MGPEARNILQKVTRADVSDTAFKFGTVQTIGIAGCPVQALRITYVGELGWELHLPVEYAQTVYAALMRAGADHGLINAGYRTIEIAQAGERATAPGARTSARTIRLSRPGLAGPRNCAAIPISRAAPRPKRNARKG